MNVLLSLWLMVQPGVTAAFVAMPSDSLLPQVHMAESAFFFGFCEAVQNTEPVQTTWLKVSGGGAVDPGGFGLGCVFLGGVDAVLGSHSGLFCVVFCGC